MSQTGSAGSGNPIVFDPASPEYIADPYPVLRRIREADPVHRTKVGWLVTRYEHVAAVLRDSRIWGIPFTAERRRSLFAPSYGLTSLDT